MEAKNAQREKMISLEEAEEKSNCWTPSSSFADHFVVCGASDDDILASYQYTLFPDTTNKSFLSTSSSELESIPISDIQLPPPRVLFRHPESKTAFPENVEWFCFPDGLTVYRSNLKNRQIDHMQIFTFIMTDSVGNHLFGVCGHYHEKLTLADLEARVVSKLPQHIDDLKIENIERTENEAFLYIPRALCFISHLPIYFELSIAMSALIQKIDSQVPFSNDIVLLTEEIPMPVPGNFGVLFQIERIPLSPLISWETQDEHPEFEHAYNIRVSRNDLSSNFFNIQVQVVIPDERLELPRKPAAGIIMLFQTFSVWGVLKLVQLVLLEQRLLFYSSNVTLLTMLIESLLALIYPFRWRHVYIPVLPSMLLDVAQAPMPYILGVHSSSFYALQKYSAKDMGDVIVVDIDGGGIRDSIFSQTQTQTQSLPTLPTHWPQDLISSLLSILLTNIIDLDLYISLLSLHKTYCINKRRHHQKKRNSSQKSIEEESTNSTKNFENMAVEIAAKEIAELFLKFLVRLLHPYRDHVFFLNEEMPIFNIDEFLDLHTDSSTRPFMSQFLNTQLFASFLDEQNSPRLQPFRRSISMVKRKFIEQQKANVPTMLVVPTRVESDANSISSEMPSAKFHSKETRASNTEPQSASKENADNVICMNLLKENQANEKQMHTKCESNGNIAVTGLEEQHQERFSTPSPTAPDSAYAKSNLSSRVIARNLSEAFIFHVVSAAMLRVRHQQRERKRTLSLSSPHNLSSAMGDTNVSDNDETKFILDDILQEVEEVSQEVDEDMEETRTCANMVNASVLPLTEFHHLPACRRWKRKSQLDDLMHYHVTSVYSTFQTRRKSVASAEETNIETIMRACLTNIFFNRVCDDETLRSCIECFGHKHARDLFALILNQSRVQEGPGQCLSSNSFDHLAELAVSALQECHIREDYQNALKIVQASVHYFHRFSSNRPSVTSEYGGKEFLQDRIQSQPICHSLDFWEHTFNWEISQEVNGRKTRTRSGSAVSRDSQRGSFSRKRSNSANSIEELEANEVTENLLLSEKKSATKKDILEKLNEKASKTQENKNSHEAFADSNIDAESKKEDKQSTYIFQSASTVLQLMLSTGVSLEKAIAFVDRVSRNYDLSQESTQTLLALTNNLHRAFSLTKEDVKESSRASEAIQSTQNPQTISRTNTGVNPLVSSSSTRSISSTNASSSHARGTTLVDRVDSFLQRHWYSSDEVLSTEQLTEQLPETFHTLDSVIRSKIMRLAPNSKISHALENKRMDTSVSSNIDLSPHRLLGHSGAIIAASLEGGRLITSGEDKKLIVWNIVTMSEDFQLKDGHTESVNCFEYRDDVIVSGSHDQTLRIWDPKKRNRSKSKVLRGHEGSIMCLGSAKSRPLTHIVSGSYDCTVKIWNLSKKKCTQTLLGHSDSIMELAVPSHIDHIISASRDGTLRLWDYQTGVCLKVLESHRGWVRCVHYDSSRLVSAGQDKTARIWDLRLSDPCVNVLSGHTGSINCMQTGGLVDPTLITGSVDCTARVWDMRRNGTEALMHTLSGHSGKINSLQWDWTKLVTGSSDGTVRVWDQHSGQLIRTCCGHMSGVTRVIFNDYTIISGSMDQTVRIWAARKQN